MSQRNRAKLAQRITSRLLASKIKEATSDGVPLSLSDSELRGLSARISPTGRVTWVASKSIGRGRGSTQRVVIGHYPGMSLNDARIEAGQTIARLARGEDVLSEAKAIKRAKVEQRQCPTFGEAVEDYLKDRWRSSTTRYEVDLRHFFERQLIPELGASTRVNTITRADIRRLLKKRKDAGQRSRARYLMASLRPFFNWCRHEEFISVSPCVDVEAPPPAKRQHKLNEQEIRALWSASQDLGIIGCYWRLLLLLMQRRCEIAGLRWREINLEHGEWIIPSTRTKNKREHLIPLPTQVVAELTALERRTGENDFVFGRYPSVPFSGFSKAKRELDAAMLSKLKDIDADAVLRDWRIHDLRRTGASLMSGVKVHGRKVPPHTIEAILNHSPGTLESIYQVWDLHRYADEKREALQAWADHLSMLALKSEAPANVLYLTA